MTLKPMSYTNLEDVTGDMLAWEKDGLLLAK
jgi:hypothetical protein